MLDFSNIEHEVDSDAVDSTTESTPRSSTAYMAMEHATCFNYHKYACLLLSLSLSLFQSLVLMLGNDDDRSFAYMSARRVQRRYRGVYKKVFSWT